MPTLRRAATIDIDCSTRTASRATGRDTAYSSAMPSRVRTWPSFSSPEVILEPRLSSTLVCMSGRRGGVGTFLIFYYRDAMSQKVRTGPRHGRDPVQELCAALAAGYCTTPRAFTIPLP